MPCMADDGWPAGDPRRYFDAPIDPVHLRESSPNVYRRAMWLAIGIVVGCGLLALGGWSIVDGGWWGVLLGVLAALVGLLLFVRGLIASNATKPFRGGPLAPGMVMEQADDTVRMLVLGEISRDPAATPEFAYRLVTFHAREQTHFVPGQRIPCVLHGFVAPPWSGRWWSFDASPITWATADQTVLDGAASAIPVPEWDQLLAGAQRLGEIRRKWTRLARVSSEDLPESLRRPPTRLGVPVEWQADGRARFVGSVADAVSV